MLCVKLCQQLEVKRGVRPSPLLPRGSEAGGRDRRVSQHPPCGVIHIPQKCIQYRKEETLASRCRGREVSAPSTLLKSSHHDKQNMKQKHKLLSLKKPGDTCEPKPQHPSRGADGGVVNDLTEPLKGKRNCLLFRDEVGGEVWRWKRCKSTGLAEPQGGSRVGDPDTPGAKAGG